MKPDDLCPQPAFELDEVQRTSPLAAPITLSTVWRCDDPEQADLLLGGQLPGYVYSRDGHPNAIDVGGKMPGAARGRSGGGYGQRHGGDVVGAVVAVPLRRPCGGEQSVVRKEFRAC